MDTASKSETRCPASPVGVSEQRTDTGAGITTSKVSTGWRAYPREHRNAVNETASELCAECQTEKVNAAAKSKL
jgi:hypothetical protein